MSKATKNTTAELEGLRPPGLQSPVSGCDGRNQQDPESEVPDPAD